MDRKIAKLERDFLRRVSQLLYEVRDPLVQQGRVSVSKTDLSKDLRVLKVFVTVNREPEVQQAVIDSLKRAARFIRGRLGENLDVRYTPEIRFHLDDSPERAARIDDILKALPADSTETKAIDPSAVGARATDGGDEIGDTDPEDEDSLSNSDDDSEDFEDSDEDDA